MAKKNNDDAIGEVALIRANNNWLWMQILAVAYEANPKEIRRVIKAIKKNDAEVIKWLDKL
jgi:hypothetical protein